MCIEAEIRSHLVSSDCRQFAKMLPDLTLEHPSLEIFLGGGMPPDPLEGTCIVCSEAEEGETLVGPNDKEA